MSARSWSAGEILALGARTDVVTAGSILGLGRTKSFELARNGEFPVKVLRLGRKYVVPTAAILRLLDLDVPSVAPTNAEGDPARSPHASTSIPHQELRHVDGRAPSPATSSAAVRGM